MKRLQIIDSTTITLFSNLIFNTKRGFIYIAKLKKSLKYTILSDTMYQTPSGLMEIRIQEVEFIKHKKGEMKQNFPLKYFYGK